MRTRKAEEKETVDSTKAEVVSPKVTNKSVDKPELRVFMLEKSFQLPRYATAGSHCFDIFANFTSESYTNYFDENNIDHIIKARGDISTPYFVVPPGARMVIPTGMVVDFDQDQAMKIYMRSGLSFKLGAMMTNSVGIIDSDYRGEVMVSLYNSSTSIMRINSGDRIAQGEIVQSEKILFKSLDERPELAKTRKGGFGSTGN